jgi:hypothetical protein
MVAKFTQVDFDPPTPADISNAIARRHLRVSVGKINNYGFSVQPVAATQEGLVVPSPMDPQLVFEDEDDAAGRWLRFGIISGRLPK